MRPVGEHNALQPVCPICSRPLRLARTAPRASDHTRLQTYGCTGCGVWLTEATDDSAD
jgi:transposase-like protein